MKIVILLKSILTTFLIILFVGGFIGTACFFCGDKSQLVTILATCLFATVPLTAVFYVVFTDIARWDKSILDRRRLYDE